MGLYFSHQSNSAYNFYAFFVAFVLLLGGFGPAKNTPPQASTKPLWLYALGSALSLCIISLVMTSLAGKVPSEYEISVPDVLFIIQPEMTHSQ